MKLFLSVTFIAMSLLSPPVWAGDEGASGGDGVLIGDKLYLVDLVEAGVEENPYIDETLQSSKDYEKVLARLQQPLQSLDDALSNRLIALKIVEIAKLSVPMAMTYLQTIEAFQWHLVNHSLIDVKDEDTALNIPLEKLVQLAIRRLHAIKVSKESWKKLNPLHRAALVFHEATYAMTHPDKQWSEIHHQNLFSQMSPKAREVVGILFSKEKSHLFTSFDSVVPGLLHYPQEDVYYERTKWEPYRSVSGWGRTSWAHVQITYSDKVYQGQRRDPKNAEIGLFCQEVGALASSIAYHSSAYQLEAKLIFDRPFGMEAQFETFLTPLLQKSDYLAWKEPGVPSYDLYLSDLFSVGDRIHFVQRECEKKLGSYLKKYQTVIGKKF